MRSVPDGIMPAPDEEMYHAPIGRSVTTSDRPTAKRPAVLLRMRAAGIGPKRPLHLRAWRQLTGQDRSRQSVAGAAVHDPKPTFKVRSFWMIESPDNRTF